MSSANVIPAQHVKVVTSPAPQRVAPKTCSDNPRISVVKDGDIVRTIEVVCACGEVIRLDCVY